MVFVLDLTFTFFFFLLFLYQSNFHLDLCLLTLKQIYDLLKELHLSLFFDPEVRIILNAVSYLAFRWHYGTHNYHAR